MGNARGIALIEFAVMLFIMGLLSSIAMPQITGALQNFKLNVAARTMLSSIRYAREMALSRHGTYGIEIDAANNSYKLFSLTNNVKTTIKDTQSQKTMDVDFDLLPQCSGVTIGTVDVCEGGSCPSKQLRFDSFGAPSDSSGTAMASAATIALSSGGATRTVRVNQETAFSEVV